jgi:N6-L-threonylcarbamoyladenine synthase
MCLSFQQAICIVLQKKLSKAIAVYQPKAVFLGGGVISNQYFRRELRRSAKPLPVLIPYSKKLFTDNAAMIGIAAYHHYQENDFVTPSADGLIDRQPNLNF